MNGLVRAARGRLYEATVEDWRDATQQERVVIVASYVGPLYVGSMVAFGPTLFHMLPILAAIGFAQGVLAASLSLRQGVVVLGGPFVAFAATGRPEAVLPALWLAGVLGLVIPPPGGYDNVD